MADGGRCAGFSSTVSSWSASTRRGDVARQVAERRPHALPRLDVPPPVGAVGVSAVPLAHRVDTVLHPPERFFVQRGVAVRHRPPEVDDPLPRRPPGQVHAVHPRLQDVRVGPAVRVRRQTEPRARLIARDVEGTALRVAHERNVRVLRKTPDHSDRSNEPKKL